MSTTQFREDEVTVIKGNPYPKVAGRLRLSHDQNESLSISTEIIRYDDAIAVVKAETITGKGSFTGIGMAGVERDQKIAHAILELAETRAISRSLRFAGYGLEFCSAEEVSHLNNGNGVDAFLNSGVSNPPVRYNGPEVNHQSQGGNPPVNGHNNTPANGNGRISGKQYKYILQLFGQSGKNKKEMDDHCLSAYGSSLQHLSKNDASSLIESLLEQTHQ